MSASCETKRVTEIDVLKYICEILQETGRKRVRFLTSNVVCDVVLASSYVQLLGMRIETCPMATLSLVAACSFSFPCVIHSLMPSTMASLSLEDGVSGEMATTTFLYMYAVGGQQDFTPEILLQLETSPKLHYIPFPMKHPIGGPCKCCPRPLSRLPRTPARWRPPPLPTSPKFPRPFFAVHCESAVRKLGRYTDQRCRVT